MPDLNGGGWTDGSDIEVKPAPIASGAHQGYRKLPGVAAANGMHNFMRHDITAELIPPRIAVSVLPVGWQIIAIPIIDEPEPIRICRRNPIVAHAHNVEKRQRSFPRQYRLRV